LVIVSADARFVVRRGLAPDSAILLPDAKPVQPMAKPQPAPSAAPKQQAAPKSVPRPEPKPAAPAVESTRPKPSSRALETRTPAADVAETLSRYHAAFVESARAHGELAAAWQGGAAEEKELARLITRTWQAARAIAANPALLAALRGQDPDEACLVEMFARNSLDKVIAQARRQMPQPEPPAPDMRM
jgi:hypothetical protein